MKTLFLFLFLYHSSSAVIHFLKYFYIESSGIQTFPEFISVVEVDDIPVLHCDTNTKLRLRQDWVKKVFDADPDIHMATTQECVVQPLLLKDNIHVLMEHFNQTGGVHILQRMSGCEWDDETGEVIGFLQYGYDGEDMLRFDLKTDRWITPIPQDVIHTLSWEGDIEENKNFLPQLCPEWLKKYLNYGRSSLRTVPPSVSLLQKTPSSPVSCHATGFYPHRAVMFWTRDGEELHEDVDQGEILPNHDGTFQMSIYLSLLKPEDWGNCECVFQLSGVKHDIVTRLEKSKIKTNESSTIIIIVIAAVVILALVIGAVGFFVYRKKSAKRPPSPVCNPEVMEQLSPFWRTNSSV